MGLAHYWRLDLDKRILVTGLLADGACREIGRFTDQIVVDEPVPFRARLADLLP